eukprot:4838115-Ditylum_brightwellii.AAC.1
MAPQNQCIKQARETTPTTMIQRKSSCGTVGLPEELACCICKSSIACAILKRKQPKLGLACKKPFDPKYASGEFRTEGCKSEYKAIMKYLEN